MYKSRRAAEKAAIEGQGGQQWDTQQCLLMQETVFSSSPANTPKKSASPNLLPATSTDIELKQLGHQLEVELQTDGGANGDGIEPIENAANESAESNTGTVATDGHIAAQENVEPKPRPSASISKVHIRRNSKGQLRKFSPEGKELLLIPANQPQDSKMDSEQNSTNDLTQRSTQKSSMSLTQKNPDSAYEQFNLSRISRVPDADAKSQTEIEASPRQQNSVRTDSTPHTYKENELHHIKLHVEPEYLEMEGPASQDRSYAAPQVEEQGLQTYEPQTPAPAVNPFKIKGSVLKGMDMFGATQASSVGRHLGSPTSSRPSPDVYNFHTLPAPRIVSSPLVRHNGDNDRNENQSETPVQSSVRSLLARMANETPQATLPRTIGAQSFDTGPVHRTNSIPEPRRYSSVQESQERRKKQSKSTTPQSDSESSSDSDIDSEPRKHNLKRKRDLDIARQLSAIEFRHRIPSIMRPSSLPPSSSPPSLPPSLPPSSLPTSQAAVEVPSTANRRRRSVQEEYLVQCDGYDARDTQQEEVVTDSQALPSKSPEAILSTPSRSDRKPDKGSDPSTSVIPTVKDILDIPPPSNNRQPSCPLQEVSSNRSALRTPLPSKDRVFSEDGNESKVPETSPPDDRLRPMGEIGLSFPFELDDDLLQNIPGFTQDTQEAEFLKALKFSTAPESPPRANISTFGNASVLPTFPKDVIVPTDTCHAVEPNHALNHVQPELEMPHAPDVSTKGSTSTKDLVDQSISLPSNGEFSMAQDKPAEPELPDLGDAVNVDRKEEPLEPPKSCTEVGSKETSKEINLIQDQPELPVPVVEERIETADPTVAKAPVSSLAEAATVAENDPQAPIEEENDLPARKTRTLQPPPSKRATRSNAKPSKSARNAKVFSTSLAGPESNTPQQPLVVENPILSTKSTTTRSSKLSSVAISTSSTPLSSPPSTLQTTDSPITRSSKRLAKTQFERDETPSRALPKRITKRKSGSSADGVVKKEPSRASKRQSISRAVKENSIDPISLISASSRGKKPAVGLFAGMAFAISYVKQEREKDSVVRLIAENGGEVLDDGFDSLFEVPKSRSNKNCDEQELVLTAAAKSMGFVALISDEHSRKAKYMQALALGLPCISGHWISACVQKEAILDWSTYLLCAGQSSVLGNAHLSRKLPSYSALEATLEGTFAARNKMLGDKSVLLVMGKDRGDGKRKTFMFLTRALGPACLGQVTDYTEARKRLMEAESSGDKWDLLYVDSNEKAAESAVFGTAGAVSGASKKRKRGPTDAESSSPPPKKIRILSDEDVVQSLIFGQLVD
ncbi:hypothetical protein G7Y89_g2497 [Cudoniella acicularis]|uniref:BRCT domain-containing protein n=1 Tax=Cudoniella acicularis TaxID=354080 RepID=A0A8H4RV31_9HELO|nr:hypothetical protein G7Y89_g2497 [Cudoniella acicularis]